VRTLQIITKYDIIVVMNEQQSLLPKPEQPEHPPVDKDLYATQIADAAQPVEYVHRPSEAAIDQGWGNVTLGSIGVRATTEVTEGSVPSHAELPQPFPSVLRKARRDARMQAHLQDAREALERTHPHVS
jgi:hypothetical protein